MSCAGTRSGTARANNSARRVWDVWRPEPYVLLQTSYLNMPHSATRSTNPGEQASAIRGQTIRAAARGCWLPVPTRYPFSWPPAPSAMPLRMRLFYLKAVTPQKASAELQGALHEPMELEYSEAGRRELAISQQNYLGSSQIHLTTSNLTNPAVFLGLGSCTLPNAANGTLVTTTYPVCSTVQKLCCAPSAHAGKSCNRQRICISQPYTDDGGTGDL